MNQKKTILIIICLFCLGITRLNAQEAFTSTGGTFSGSGGSASSSIGQIVFTSSSGTSGNINQGVQQPYEFYIVGIETINGINLEYALYPNPAIEYVILNIENFNNENFNYQLFDLKGTLLINKRINDKASVIVLGNLPIATYFLKVFENNKEVKSFKIIKK